MKKSLFTIIVTVFLFFVVPHLAFARGNIDQVSDTCNQIDGQDKVALCETALKSLNNLILQVNEINGVYNTNKDSSKKSQLSEKNDDAYNNYDAAYSAFKDVKSYLEDGNISEAQNSITFINQKAYFVEKDLDDVAQIIGQSREQIDQAAIKSANTKTCLYWFGVNFGVCFREVIGWGLYGIVVIMWGMVSLAGLLLNSTITYTVVDIAKNIGAITSIGSIWVLFRDIANLSFIFLLLYVAIATMFQASGVNWKRTLVQIIIAAILINFSLFITKVIIDFSNLIALGFYNQIKAMTPLPAGSTFYLSDAFMNMLGLGTIISDAAQNVLTWAQSWSALASNSLGIIAVLFVTAFSFFAAAWLFIFRFFVIIVLLIISPIAFASRAFPKLNKLWERWWNALTGQALFPIIYMLFIWITIKIGTELFATGGGTLTQAFDTASTNGGGAIEDKAVAITNIHSADPGFLTVLIKYILIIVLLNAALIFAKQQASNVGKFGASILNKGLDRVDKMRKTTIGVAQRNLVNRPMRRVRRTYNNTIATRGMNIVNTAKATGSAVAGSGLVRGTGTAAGWVGRKTGLNRPVGAVARTTANAVGKVVDVAGAAKDRVVSGAQYLGNTRAAEMAGNFAKGAAKVTGAVGINAGARKVGEFGKFVGTAALIGADRSVNENLKAGEDFKVKDTENLAEYEKYTKGRERDLKETKAQYEQDKKLEEALNVSISQLTSANQDLIKQLTDLQKNMSGKDIEDLYSHHKERMSAAFLATLDQSKFDAFLKSDKVNLTEAEKKDFRDRREAALMQMIEGDKDPISGTITPPSAATVAAFSEFIQKKKPTDLAELPGKVLEAMAGKNFVTGAVLDQIMSKGSMSEPDRAKIRAKIDANYTANATDIDAAIDKAHTRLATAIQSRMPAGTTIDQAKAKIDIKNVRITANDVTPPQGKTAEAFAAELERVRKSSDYLASNRGMNF